MEQLSQLQAFVDAEVTYHQQSLDILQAVQDTLKRKYVVSVVLLSDTVSPPGDGRFIT